MTPFSFVDIVMMSSTTNWFDLTSDLKINILHRIGPPEILENAQKVCTDWYNVCKDPSMWKVIDMYTFTEKVNLPTCTKMSKIAVDRSQGQLTEMVIPRIGTDEVLMYVAARARQLKRLTMVCSFFDPSIESLAEALKNFPLLEELIMYATDISKEFIISAGRYCPLLKTLIIDQGSHGFCNTYCPLNDEIAVAIGENFSPYLQQNLHELKHLKLLNNGVSNVGLKALIDGCRQLESLDLSLCSNLNLKGDVVKRCKEQIKRLTLPQPHRLTLREMHEIFGYPHNDNDEDDSDNEDLDREVELVDYLNDYHMDYYMYDVDVCKKEPSFGLVTKLKQG
ncbi:putative F-box/LRR-repeat protein 9 [Rutidosis leptorrhynchoides]|uniref:putative F-box/LRR-repeat protein 9 n=1 Tax=Rutidosis leptorrhynchoides TaxID=125765 RepID=UPI003A9A1E32